MRLLTCNTRSALTVQNNHLLRQTDRPFGTCFLADAKERHSQVASLVAWSRRPWTVVVVG